MIFYKMGGGDALLFMMVVGKTHCQVEFLWRLWFYIHKIFSSPEPKAPGELIVW